MTNMNIITKHDYIAYSPEWKNTGLFSIALIPNQGCKSSRPKRKGRFIDQVV